MKVMKLFELLGRWQDERKELSLRYNYLLVETDKEIARRFKYGLAIIQYSLPVEIENLLLHNKRLDLSEIKKRRKFILAYRDKNGLKIFSGQKAKKYLDLFLERVGHEKEIKGMPVSRGADKIIRGEVVIVLDTRETDFPTGKILVTSMTRPEFVPLMCKAKAVITNEGGITSHAAIVSRELGITCIVGTKVATKLLKTGDLVEINSETGEVRLLSK